MFSESLLDDSAGRARRSWSTLAAWTLQSCLIVLAVVLPLWQTNALPRMISSFTPIGPPPGRTPAPKSIRVAGDPVHHRVVPLITPDGLTLPLRIPKGVKPGPDIPPPIDDTEGQCAFCVPGGIPGGGGTGPGMLTKLIPQPTEAPPTPKPPVRVRMSGGITQGFLLHQVQPVYPAIARAARVEGTVVLAAVISRDGTIEGLHAVGGPAMLINAAMDAVKQWRYRPYLLSGQPVEVETQISVVFTLAH